MSCDIRLSTKQKQFGKFLCAVVVVVIIALVVDFTKSNGSHHSQSLKFVIVVTRHGVRGPLKGYPKDPYSYNSTTNYWPDGQTALTTIGKNQLYNVGITLRQLYDGFLNTHYLSSEFEARSTLIERTLQSAGSLLAGLYPPKDYQLWNKDIQWQPIPIYPNYLDKEVLIARAFECPKFWKLQNESIKLAEDHSDDYNKVVQAVTTNAGWNGSDILNLALVYDALFCESNNGLKLPEWTKAIYPSPLSSVINKHITARLVGNEEMIRLLTGLMLGAFVDSMKKSVNDKENKERRMIYYSSHDNTLKGILASLGFVDTPLIQFATTFLLELHSNPTLPSGNEVKFFQIDGSSEHMSPQIYEIPNCKPICDFEQFLQITNKYYNNLNWTKECQL